MSRSKCKLISGCRQLLKQTTFQLLAEYRHSVSEKYYISSISAQLFCNHFNIYRHLRFQNFHIPALKRIDSGIDLIPSGIHERADQPFCSIKVICQRIYCWNGYQRFFQCKTQPFCCSRTNSKSGKRTRSCCHRNGINGFQIQLRHLHNRVQHRQECL